MRHRYSLIAALVCGAASAQSMRLTQVTWLAGCWASEAGEAGSGEQWMPAAGGTMFGVGRTVRNGKTAEFEFLQIRINAEGKLVYIALPSGQQQASFVASSISASSITFENLQHDFPQRIIYTALPGERLRARIEGMRDGSLRGIDYAMKRVRCEELAGSQ